MKMKLLKLANRPSQSSPKVAPAPPLGRLPGPHLPDPPPAPHHLALALGHVRTPRTSLIDQGSEAIPALGQGNRVMGNDGKRSISVFSSSQYFAV